ncbi:hypothetical protein L6258_02700 [Candidatus Parcubacteria bacterium]|nr:hypothetical protein [Candidatus Parcubacteria bacterium]
MRKFEFRNPLTKGGTVALVIVLEVILFILGIVYFDTVIRRSQEAPPVLPATTMEMPTTVEPTEEPTPAPEETPTATESATD